MTSQGSARGRSRTQGARADVHGQADSGNGRIEGRTHRCRRRARYAATSRADHTGPHASRATGCGKSGRATCLRVFCLEMPNVSASSWNPRRCVPRICTEKSTLGNPPARVPHGAGDLGHAGARENFRNERRRPISPLSLGGAMRRSPQLSCSHSRRREGFGLLWVHRARFRTSVGMQSPGILGSGLPQERAESLAFAFAYV